MTKCRKPGCRQWARWPTHFCSRHASGEDRVASAPPPKEPIKLATGFFRKFTVCDRKNLDNISKFAEEYYNSFDLPFLKTGFRKVLKFPGNPTVESYLHSIVGEAKKKIAFPLLKPRISAPALIVAPPVSSRSSPWSCGPIHRDFDDIESTGVYSFLLCVDDVTEDNGAVLFWPESKKWPLDSKKSIPLSTVTLAGPKGTVFVWDSRMLHRSLPNKTNHVRKALSWFVNSQSKPALTIIV